MEIKTNGTQKEAKVLEITRKETDILHYDIVYDTMKPEETLRQFVAGVKEMLARYDGNKARIAEIELELNDIEHYMEIGKFKNVPEGYKLYRKLAELRRERRKCKNENDLLWPVYEHFHGTEVLKRMSLVQGECAKLKETIDGRYYTVRTDILEEWTKPEEDTEEPGGVTTEQFFGMHLSEEASKAEDSVRKWKLAWKNGEEEVI